MEAPKGSNLGSAIDLPDFTVFLRSGTVTSQEALTGLSGGYVIPAGLAQGTYDFCYLGPGVGETCLPNLVTVKATEVYQDPIKVRPSPRTSVHGRVTLQDGALCTHHYPAFGVEADAWLRAFDTNGDPISEPVRANSSGIYYLFNALGEVVQDDFIAEVRATCEGSSAQAATASPGPRVDLVFNNRTPHVQHVQVRANNTVVDWADAGATVELAATVVDQDGDPLDYHWAHTGAQTFIPAAQSATWKVLDIEARQQAVVLVGDGRGGYDLHPAAIDTGKEVIRFSGVVREPGGAPVAGATVTINGEPITTNSRGGFHLIVSQKSSRYVVNVRKIGYVLTSEVYYKPLEEARLELIPCPGQPFDPALDFIVLARPRKNGDEISRVPPTEILLRGGTLVDGGGAPPPGQLMACGFPYTPDDTLPGDYTAVSGNGDFVYLESLGAVWVEIWDPATDKLYNLDQEAGATAEITMPVDPRQTGVAPEKLDFWSYDEKEGYWRLEGKAQRASGFYRADAHHFSVANIDIQKKDAACIRVHTDTSQQSVPYDIRITAPTSTGAPKTVTREIDNALSVIIRLPENSGVQVEVLDANGNVADASWTQTVNSGARVPGLANTNPSSPYPECNSDVLIPPTPNLQGRAFLTRHLLSDHKDSNNNVLLSASAAANAYYAAIDPNDAKDTLCKFAVAGGFLPAATNCANYNIAGLRNDTNFNPDAEAFYKNDGDLGFGRSMFLKKNGQDVFMFVGNHPSADTAQGNAGLIATVAMDYSKGPNGNDRYTKFYVYNAQGNRVNNAPLDPFGAKYVPDLCVMCHGGSPAGEAAIYNNGTTLYPNDGRIDAKFLPFALETFLYPQLEDPTNLADPEPFDRDSQEENFRKLNEAVLATNATAANAELIRGWYGAAANATVLPAVDQNSGWVPPDWIANPSLYSQVVQPSCRTCHISFSLDWADASDFSAQQVPLVQSRVCGPGNAVMPQAYRTWTRFWQSSNPHQPFKLATDLAATGWSANQACPQ